MSLAQALLVDAVAPSFRDLAVAANVYPMGCYRDTEHRANMRGLMHAAAATGAQISLAFLKQDGSLRYMRCVPTLEDGTYQYVTVRDLELTETRGCAVYRRVNLDTVARLQLEYGAGRPGATRAA